MPACSSVDLYVLPAPLHAAAGYLGCLAPDIDGRLREGFYITTPPNEIRRLWEVEAGFPPDCVPCHGDGAMAFTAEEDCLRCCAMLDINRREVTPRPTLACGKAGKNCLGWRVENATRRFSKTLGWAAQTRNGRLDIRADTPERQAGLGAWALLVVGGICAALPHDCPQQGPQGLADWK